MHSLLPSHWQVTKLRPLDPPGGATIGHLRTLAPPSGAARALLWLYVTILQFLYILPSQWQRPLIILFVYFYLSRLGIQVYEIMSPTHGLEEHYKKCFKQGRLHVPSTMFILGKFFIVWGYFLNIFCEFLIILGEFVPHFSKVYLLGIFCVWANLI